MKYAYKVVRKTNTPGVYTSLYSVYPMKYKIGEKTVAKGGGLLAYKLDTGSFSESGAFQDTAVLKVAVGKQVDLPTLGRLDHTIKVTMKALRDFWKKGLGEADWSYWADGTVAFEDVTPLYEVDAYTRKRIRAKK